jgi:hypothetical protein
MPKLSNNHRIDYVEFNVGDIARSRAFYGAAFGWSFKDYGPSYCEFSDGRLTGGFALADKDGAGDPARAMGPLVILYAADLTDTQRRLEDAGASIVKPTYSFPGGRRFHFADADGYVLAVWSDK